MTAAFLQPYMSRMAPKNGHTSPDMSVPAATVLAHTADTYFASSFGASCLNTWMGRDSGSPSINRSRWHAKRRANSWRLPTTGQRRQMQVETLRESGDTHQRHQRVDCHAGVPPAACIKEGPRPLDPVHAQTPRVRRRRERHGRHSPCPPPPSKLSARAEPAPADPLHPLCSPTSLQCNVTPSIFGGTCAVSTFR